MKCEGLLLLLFVEYASSSSYWLAKCDPPTSCLVEVFASYVLKKSGVFALNISEYGSFGSWLVWSSLAD